MSYAFKRSSEVFLVIDGVGYSLPTLSDFSLSQTISEKTIQRRNQFSRIAPKKIINRTKNTGSGSIEFYYSSSCKVFPALLTAMDFEFNLTGTLTFRNEFSNIPKAIHLIVKDRLTGALVVIPRAYITNIDIGASPRSINSIVVGFEYADTYEDLVSPVHFMQSPDPVYPAPTYIDFIVGTTQINSVKTAAFTITRSISWLSSGANQFNLNSVVGSSNPVVSEYNITATATANDTSNTPIKHMSANTADVRIGNNALKLYIPKARVTTRKSIDDVFTISFDIKHQSLLPVVLGGTYEHKH